MMKMMMRKFLYYYYNNSTWVEWLNLNQLKIVANYFLNPNPNKAQKQKERNDNWLNK